MRKFIQQKLKNQKGLTLIELLAVIVILAIIAAIAIPAIGNIIENSRYSAVKADATNALAAANIYFAENPEEIEVTLNDLADGYLDDAGKIPTDVVVDNNEIVKNAAGALTISTTPIIYSGTKTLTFTAATKDGINSDAATNKGSDAGNKAIIN